MIGRVTFSLILAATSLASAQSVKTRMEKGVDMVQYETFTVIKGDFMAAPESKQISEASLFNAIRTAVRREMEDRGYKFIEDSTAQLRVGYVAGSYNLTDAGVNGPLGQTPASNASDINQSRNWSHTTREGMLVLDITDSSTKKVLWKADVQDLGLDDADFKRVLDAAVFKAFKKFPDKRKKRK